jgi:hypothetical protein
MALCWPCCCRYHELGDAAASVKADLPRAATVFIIMRGLLYTAASEIRLAFTELAAAIESFQPGASAAVEAHMTASAAKWRAWVVAGHSPAADGEGGAVAAAAEAQVQAELLADVATAVTAEEAAVEEDATLTDSKLDEPSGPASFANLLALRPVPLQRSRQQHTPPAAGPQPFLPLIWRQSSAACTAPLSAWTRLPAHRASSAAGWIVRG